MRFGGPGPPGGAEDRFPGWPPPPAGAEWRPICHHVWQTGPLNQGPAQRPLPVWVRAPEGLRGPRLWGSPERGSEVHGYQPGQLCPSQLHNGSEPSPGPTRVGDGLPPHSLSLWPQAPLLSQFS